MAKTSKNKQVAETPVASTEAAETAENEATATATEESTAGEAATATSETDTAKTEETPEAAERTGVAALVGLLYLHFFDTDKTREWERAHMKPLLGAGLIIDEGVCLRDSRYRVYSLTELGRKVYDASLSGAVNVIKDNAKQK